MREQALPQVAQVPVRVSPRRPAVAGGDGRSGLGRVLRVLDRLEPTSAPLDQAADAQFGIAQEPIEASLQPHAPLVQLERLLERLAARFQLGHDALELGQGRVETELVGNEVQDPAPARHRDLGLTPPLQAQGVTRLAWLLPEHQVIAKAP